jgi:hypothetical protein
MADNFPEHLMILPFCLGFSSWEISIFKQMTSTPAMANLGNCHDSDGIFSRLIFRFFLSLSSQPIDD